MTTTSESKEAAPDVVSATIANNNNDDDLVRQTTSRVDNSEVTSHVIGGEEAPNKEYGADGTGGGGIDFLQDSPKDMTLARRIALHLSRRYKWYNPALGSEDEQLQTAGSPTKNTRTNNEMDAEEKEEEKAVEREEGQAEETAPPPVRRYSDKRKGSDPLANATDAYPFTYSSEEKPSIEKAWAYFEHDTLPRYIVEPKSSTSSSSSTGERKSMMTKIKHRFSKADQQFQRAEPGENSVPTRLYHPIFTPHKQLGDWGLGMGLYFTTLRGIAVLTILATILNLGNMLYFAGEEYSCHQQGVDAFAKGSAICTHTKWVPCDDCTDSSIGAAHRVAFVNLVNGTTLTFALRNECEGATIAAVSWNYATLFFVAIGIVLLNAYAKGLEVAFDEDEQTAQDYSILIDNPPGDAKDPDEWKKFFFEKFDGAHATTCTVAVDNDLLVRTLVERREILRKIETKIDPGTSLDTLSLAKIAAKQESERKFVGKLLSTFVPGIPDLFGRLTMLNGKVQGLAQQNYPATKIFISFETEAAQRRVLSALSVGTLDASRNNKSAISNPEHLFRGEHLLHVVEPDEPNTIRWQDLNEKFKERMKQQALTCLTTFGMIILLTYLVHVLNANVLNSSGTALIITILNIAFPEFAKLLTTLEAHSTESGKQRSLYYKIAVFRWVNTAVVLAIVQDFTVTLENHTGLIDQISALFFAEIVTMNAIKLADPMGHIKRHYLAPRAKTQDAMNIAMQGAPVELADLYTNMTKVLFLALWYCSIYPAGLYKCCAALAVTYFTDRFALMRTWKRAPNFGTTVSEFSRRYFFPLAIAAMAVISSYYWSSFPFDNLCRHGDASQIYVGKWLVRHVIPDSEELSFVALNQTQSTSEYEFVEVEEGDPAYRYCHQDFFRYPKGDASFPFVPSNQIEGEEWMTGDQETMTTIYGWTSMVVLGLVVLKFLMGWLEDMKGLFRATYQPRGEDQGINFSDVPSINTYVPMVRSASYSYPLLACNMDGIDLGLLDWTDPDRPHSFYDLTKDAEVLLRRTDYSTEGVFSRLAHYPPPS